MTRGSASSLRNILEDLLDEYESLLETSRSKQEALRERDVEALEECTEREEALAGQIQQLNRERMRECREIMGGDPPEDRSVTLEEVEESLEPAARRDLGEVRSRLVDVVRDVQRITRENMGLLENRIAVFDQLFDRLTGSDEESETYTRGLQTEKQQADGPMFVDGMI